ncbi:serine hydrolase domain-containing protein [Sphingomonas crusticola]|uniref:serine hydrolase domain-containing protein n=1 Tax=Sphingomonas crusticola TaxID=1697973 RepID=UPI000E25D4F9|nr:serine hydrolase domain-containing protein [Sphingomonas crusticola]
MKKIAMKAVLALGLTSLSVAVMAQAPADTPGKSAAGLSYVQPAEWAKSSDGPITLFTAPEGDLKIAVVEVGKASDAQAAAAQAWARYRPAMVRPIQLAAAGARGEGWDEKVNLVYLTSPAEHVSVSAVALRNGELWTVLLQEGSEATLNKRSAASSVIAQGLRPAGYERESFAGRTAHRLTPERIQALRDFVAASARALEVPGVGLALIDQGKVVWQGGIGVRALGSPEPVTAHTKFMVASNTKGMSTLLLSVLADEGKLRWDQRVIDLYPSFRLGGDETTRATLVRHLVCACTGLPRKDYAFILANEGAPASSTFTELAQTVPTSKFGQLFQYNNLMAAAAGYVGGHLAYPKLELGAAYDKAMQTRIFDPLGMRDSTFDYKKGESGDWARPHGLDIDGRMTLMSNYFNLAPYPYRPAGGAWSSTADMARYAQLELSKGLSPEGKRIVSEANLLERRKPGVAVDRDTRYGMGLFARDAWGIPVVTHGGTLLGYHSNFYVLPDAGIGAVLLTNADPGAAMLGPFLRRLLEVVYDGKPEAADDIAAAAARSKVQVKARRARLTYPGDPAVLAALASTYRSPEGSQITFRERNGAKWMKAGFIEGPVATRKNPDGSVSVVSAGPGSIGADALVGTKDGLRTLLIRDSQHEYFYTEVR